jgi:hypothetical protein
MHSLCCGSDSLLASCGVNVEADEQSVVEQEVPPPQSATPLEPTELNFSVRNALYRERKAAGICVICGKRYAPFGMIRCIGCIERDKEYYSQRVLDGRCTKCGKQAVVEGKVHCQYCLDKKNGNREKKYQELKDEVYAAYGGYKCVGCGETEPACLQLDHINNDGHKYKEEHTSGVGTMLYLKKNDFPPIIQILCANCNWKKRVAFHEEQKKLKEGAV